MRPVVTDILWLMYVSVCALDTLVSPTKMAEPLEMPFGMWTCVVLDHPTESGIWGRHVWAYPNLPAVDYQHYLQEGQQRCSLLLPLLQQLVKRYSRRLQPVFTDFLWSVCLCIRVSVSLSVAHVGESHKNGWSIRTVCYSSCSKRAILLTVYSTSVGVRMCIFGVVMAMRRELAFLEYCKPFSKPRAYIITDFMLWQLLCHF